jgi:hypothetical protein
MVNFSVFLLVLSDFSVGFSDFSDFSVEFNFSVSLL